MQSSSLHLGQLLCKPPLPSMQVYKYSYDDSNLFYCPNNVSYTVSFGCLPFTRTTPPPTLKPTPIPSNEAKPCRLVPIGFHCCKKGQPCWLSSVTHPCESMKARHRSCSILVG
eukprot:Sspe_Gene.100113::Locus_74801_Transcript_1_1_Confidence_1.000_Length_2100::g.100113::m.100113